MLNASSREVDACPCRIATRNPCFVPAPPGENGSSVERLSATWESSALWTVALTWKARRNQNSEAIRQTQLASCQLTTSRTYRRRSRRMATPAPTRFLKLSLCDNFHENQIAASVSSATTVAPTFPCRKSQPQSNDGVWTLGTTPIESAHRKNAVASTKSSSVSVKSVEASVV